MFYEFPQLIPGTCPKFFCLRAVKASLRKGTMIMLSFGHTPEPLEIIYFDAAFSGYLACQLNSSVHPHISTFARPRPGFAPKFFASRGLVHHWGRLP